MLVSCTVLIAFSVSSCRTCVQAHELGGEVVDYLTQAGEANRCVDSVTGTHVRMQAYLHIYFGDGIVALVLVGLFSLC